MIAHAEPVEEVAGGLHPRCYRPLGDLAVQIREAILPGKSDERPYLALEHVDSGDILARRQGTCKDVRSSKFVFRRGDVLYGKLRPYLDKAVLAEWDGLASTEFLILRPRQHIDAQFLAFTMHSPRVIARAIDTTGGVNHPRTSWDSLRLLDVYCPPPDEQRRIAKMLSTIEQAKQAHTNVMQASIQLRSSLRELLFGELSESTTLGECAHIASGGTPSRSEPEYWGGEIPWVTTSEIDYSVIQQTRECITSRGLAESSTRLFPAGTILMAMYGNGVTRGRVARLGIAAAVNQACATVTSRNGVDARYLYQYLAYRYEDLRNLGHGAHQKNLSATLVKQFPVALPGLTHQQRIARWLDVVDSSVAAERGAREAVALTLDSALLHVFRNAA